jgi:SpoVK/Ycf46/Vps4 family AAA+-type ATPase
MICSNSQGRLHHLIHIPNPSIEERQEILNYFCVKYELPQIIIDRLKLSLESVGDYPISGADIQWMCQEGMMERYSQQLAQSESQSYNIIQHEMCK